MQTNKTKVWFPAKRYGWGWGFPCAWQGWVVMGTFLILLLTGGLFLAPRNIGLFVAYAVALCSVLFLIVFIKGESPRWRWGEDKNVQPQSLAERLSELEDLRRRQLISELEYKARRQEILGEK
jgi:hypothetical protein